MNYPLSIVNRIKENPDLPGISYLSGSQPFYGMTSQDASVRRSNRISISRRHFEIEGETFMVALHDSDEPRTFNEAIASCAKELWIKAMNEEMDSMKSNQVWDLVDLPPKQITIGNKWVLRIKH